MPETEAHGVEKARPELKQIIERQVEQRTEFLQKYIRELEESNAIKDLWTDILSHDLQNPAGVCWTSAEILLDYETDPKKVKFLKLIRNAASNLIERIENAAKFSKLQQQKQIECELLDLNAILKDILVDFVYQLEDKQISLDCLAKGKFPARANFMIGDVFSNILSNAVKYSAPGSRIEIDIQERGNRWIVSIKDFGEGIQEEDKDKIFTRFERLGKNVVRGTGLGLAIAKRVVDLHDGQIWVEDNPEGGSIFYVSLRKEGPEGRETAK